MKTWLCSLTVLLLTAPLAQAEGPALNLERARKLSQAAFVCADRHQFHLSVAIVNSEGNLLLFERGENSFVGSIDAAITKARSANAFQRPTSAFAQALKEGRTQLLSVPGLVALEGGVPIVIGGQYVGAIGISGAKSVEDEACALEALKSLP